MNKLYNFTFFIGLLPYFSSDCGKMYHKQNLRKEIIYAHIYKAPAVRGTLRGNGSVRCSHRHLRGRQHKARSGGKARRDARTGEQQLPEKALCGSDDEGHRNDYGKAPEKTRCECIQAARMEQSGERLRQNRPQRRFHHGNVLRRILSGEKRHSRRKLFGSLCIEPLDADGLGCGSRICRTLGFYQSQKRQL